MHIRYRGWAIRLLLLAICVLPGQALGKHLVIGITQYPSTFNPIIDSMLAKSYVNGLTRRPITTIDPDWKLVCMLCVKLPTLE